MVVRRVFYTLFLVVWWVGVGYAESSLTYASISTEVDKIAGFWFDSSKPDEGGGHVWVGVDAETGEARLLKVRFDTGEVLEEFKVTEGWIDDLVFQSNGKRVTVLANYARHLVDLPLGRGRMMSWKVRSSGFEIDAPFRLLAGPEKDQMWTRGGFSSGDKGIYEMKLGRDGPDFEPVLIFKNLLEQSAIFGPIKNLALSPARDWGVFTVSGDPGVKLYRFTVGGKEKPTMVAHGPAFQAPALTPSGVLLYQLQGMDTQHAITVSGPGKEPSYVTLPDDWVPTRLIAWSDADRAVVAGIKGREQKLFVLEADSGWKPRELELSGVSAPFRYKPGPRGRLVIQDREGLFFFKI